jgi:hypothetical protein
MLIARRTSAKEDQVLRTGVLDAMRASWRNRYRIARPNLTDLSVDLHATGPNQNIVYLLGLRMMVTLREHTWR